MALDLRRHRGRFQAKRGIHTPRPPYRGTFPGQARETHPATRHIGDVPRPKTANALRDLPRRRHGEGLWVLRAPQSLAATPTATHRPRSVAVAAPAARTAAAGGRRGRGGGDDGLAGWRHGIPGPAKGLDALARDVARGLVLDERVERPAPTVTIEAPLVAFAADRAVLMPWTEGTPAPAGVGTGGQYCRHCTEQVECPAVSAVSR